MRVFFASPFGGTARVTRRAENRALACCDNGAPRIETDLVIAIDRAVTNDEGSDETRIVVAGIDGAGHGFLIADISGH